MPPTHGESNRAAEREEMVATQIENRGVRNARVLDAMRSEASAICQGPVTDQEIERVKNRHRTSLAIESEVPYHRLMHLMDDMEYHGEPRTVDQMLAEIDAVSTESIHDYFAAFPINHGGHLTSVGPRRWPEDA